MIGTVPARKIKVYLGSDDFVFGEDNDLILLLIWILLINHNKQLLAIHSATKMEVDGVESGTQKFKSVSKDRRTELVCNRS